MSIIKFCAAALVFAGIALQAGAQSERVEQMRRVVDGLNSADPVVRFATLEEAIGGEDTNLKNLAIQTALSSDDSLLRSTALSGVFAGKKSFVVQVAPVDGDNNHAIFANDVIANRLEVFIKDFDPSNGSFLARSPWTYWRAQDNKRIYVWENGVFDGERVSFMVDMNKLDGNNDAPCRGSAQATAGSKLLTGKMACEQGSYDIEIDILN